MKAQERLDYLDSLRGIAALVVVLHHCTMMYADDFRISHKILPDASASFGDWAFYLFQTLLNGRAAVILFFVLSGFVLALSLLKQSTPYASYAIRRICRIYPAFAFIIFTSYALHSLIGVQHPVDSGWLDVVINPDMSFSVLCEHLALWGGTSSAGLNGVIWTLVHEMRISLIFPFVLFTIVRYGWYSMVGYGLLSITCTALVYYQRGVMVGGYDALSFSESLLSSAFFIIFFAAGAFLAIHRGKVADFVARQSVWKRLFCIVLLAFCFIKSDVNFKTWMANMTDVLHGIGSLGLIAFALGCPGFRNVLTHKFLAWLGLVSYSLYLVHTPILYTLNQTIGSEWPIPLTAFVLIGSSLCVADILYRMVELPFIKAGKKLCEWYSAPAVGSLQATKQAA